MSVKRGVGVVAGASRRILFRVRVRVDTNMVTTQHHGYKNDRSTRARVIARVICTYCNVPIQMKLKLIFKGVLMTCILTQLKVYFSLLYAE